MSKDNGGLSDQRLKERLRALRDINRRHDRGEISDEERRRLHEELIPGFSKHRRRPDAKGQEMTIAEFEKQFPDDAACKAYFTHHRWPSGVCCPRCGNVKVYELERSFHWQCNECAPQGYHFSVLVGTIFENTHMPLRTWFRVIHMMMTSKKGVSALQVHRTIGTGSYRTAWSMCHKIRAALQNQDFAKLIGIVEVDETFVGGKAKNRHKDKRGGGDGTGGTGSGKMPVGGAVQRKGQPPWRIR